MKIDLNKRSHRWLVFQLLKPVIWALNSKSPLTAIRIIRAIRAILRMI